MERVRVRVSESEKRVQHIRGDISGREVADGVLRCPGRLGEAEFGEGVPERDPVEFSRDMGNAPGLHIRAHPMNRRQTDRQTERVQEAHIEKQRYRTWVRE
jgi:hypothetical protein